MSLLSPSKRRRFRIFFLAKAARLLCWNPLLKPLTMPSQRLGFMALSRLVLRCRTSPVLGPMGVPWVGPCWVCLLVHKLHSHTFAIWMYLYIPIYISTIILAISGGNLAPLCPFSWGFQVSTHQCAAVLEARVTWLLEHWAVVPTAKVGAIIIQGHPL